MAYGSVLADTVQSSTAGTAPTFKDGNGTETGTLCRAWVNFNGTGTVAIRASFNVSSITDNGSGNYTVNFTAAMPDANYSTNVSVRPTGSNLVDTCCIADENSGTYTTSAVEIWTGAAGSGTARDALACCVAIFR